MLSPGAGAPLPSPTVPSAAAPHGSGSDREERRRREAREEEDTARESERQRIPQPLRVKEKGVSIDKECSRVLFHGLYDATNLMPSGGDGRSLAYPSGIGEESRAWLGQ
ncbi:unnamed protein product [Sphagnum troendelagicum]